MNYDNSVTVIGDARAHAMATAHRDDSPPDPEAGVRESIRSLDAFAPSVGTAAALLSVAGVRPVALDRESLEPTTGPLSSLAGVEAHWRGNPADGVGVRAGVQANGSTIFGVRGTVAAVRSWLADTGTEVREIRNEYGTVIHVDRSYRPTTAFVQVGWSPPARQPARSVTSYGAGLLDRQNMLPGDQANAERSLGVTGWLTWSVAGAWTVAPSVETAGAGLRLTVRSRKLGNGLDVVGEGDVIPWHVCSSNGWQCHGQNMPIAGGELSPWIADAVGAKWEATR